jgi:LysR family transcriptional activator of nhaA
MDWLNYHHLRYFHVVAREGSIVRASRALHTSPPSISAQLRLLEQRLGERLFRKQGRGLVLTGIGEVVRDYAEQIFSLGGELLATVRSGVGARLTRLRVGVADAVAKELAARLLGPVFEGPQPVRVLVNEGPAARLLAELALHRLDLVLLDEPPPAVERLKVFQHPLGDAAIGVFAPKASAARLRRRFPRSLGGLPFILPPAGNLLRSAFEGLLRREEVDVAVVAEVDDSGLAKTLAREGRGAILAPAVLAPVLARHHGLLPIGELPGVRVPYIACTVARHIDNPLVEQVLSLGRDLLHG